MPVLVVCAGGGGRLRSRGLAHIHSQWVPRAALDITSLCVSPTEELLLCGCSSSQLASFPLANIDILQPEQHHSRSGSTKS